MATVAIYHSEQELQAGVGGTVQTFKDEAQLNVYLDTITIESIIVVVKNGTEYTTITDATATFLANVVKPILAKGVHYVAILA